MSLVLVAVVFLPAASTTTLHWSTLGELDSPRGGQCSQVQLLTLGSSLYALGGGSLQAAVYRSSNAGVSWERIASNAYSPAVDCFATAVTSTRIHVLGGATCYMNGFARCQTGAHWSSVDGITFVSETAFPEASTAAFFTAVGVTINAVDYVYTSASGCCAYTNTIRRYNTESKSWQFVTSITSDSSGNNYGFRCCNQIRATSDGTLYLGGGGDQTLGYVERKDLWVSKDYGYSWKKCSLSPGGGPSIIGYGDTLFIFGQKNMWTTSDKGETFTSWSQTLDNSPLPSSFDIGTWASYAVLNGDIFLVIGGPNERNVIRSSLVAIQAPATSPAQYPTINEVFPEFSKTSDRFSLLAIKLRIQLGNSPDFFMFLQLVCHMNELCLNFLKFRSGFCNRMG